MVRRAVQAFGELALLCNIPQPQTVTALELVHVLRLDKEALSSLISMFIVDGREVLFALQRCCLCWASCHAFWH